MENPLINSGLGVIFWMVLFFLIVGVPAVFAWIIIIRELIKMLRKK